MLCEQFHPLQDVYSAEKLWVSVYLNCHQCQQQAPSILQPGCRQTKSKHSIKYVWFMRLCLTFILISFLTTQNTSVFVITINFCFRNWWKLHWTQTNTRRSLTPLRMSIWNSDRMSITRETIVTNKQQREFNIFSSGKATNRAEDRITVPENKKKKEVDLTC